MAMPNAVTSGGNQPQMLCGYTSILTFYVFQYIYIIFVVGYLRLSLRLA